MSFDIVLIYRYNTFKKTKEVIFMKNLLTKKSIKCYRLSKQNNVTQLTLTSFALNNQKDNTRISFDVFKSNICHLVKDKGDIDFMIDLLQNDDIRILYEKKWYPEAFYLLAMLDYLSRENNIPLCTKYDYIRKQKLEKPLYPSSLKIMNKVLNINSDEIINKAIPEFLHFNIIESEIRNIY